MCGPGAGPDLDTIALISVQNCLSVSLRLVGTGVECWREMIAILVILAVHQVMLYIEPESLVVEFERNSQ